MNTKDQEVESLLEQLEELVETRTVREMKPGNRSRPRPVVNLFEEEEGEPCSD